MKQLNAMQRLFVANRTRVTLALDALKGTEAKITAEQWPAADPIIGQIIVRNFAEKGVKLWTKTSQRTRAGWSKMTFDGNDDARKTVAKANVMLQRIREAIERNNGYVVERAKADPVARMVKAFDKLTEAQQRRFLARVK